MNLKKYILKVSILFVCCTFLNISKTQACGLVGNHITDLFISVKTLQGGAENAHTLLVLPINKKIFSSLELLDKEKATTLLIKKNNPARNCDILITAEDYEAPIAVCQDITIRLSESGMATISATDVDGGSTSNLGEVTLMINQDTFDCGDLGDNSVILTVTDVNGNTSMCTATVTIEDITPPIIECPFFFDFETDPGVCTAEVSFPNAIFIDHCSGTQGTIEQIAGLPSGSDFPLGDNEIIFMATDPSGNSATCVFIITVVDREGPVFNKDTLPEDIVRFIDPVEDIYILEDFTIDIAVMDNCSEVETRKAIAVSQSPSAGTELEQGTYNITLTAEDEAGNETDYIFVLDVEESLGVDEKNYDLSSIRLFPNPVKGNIILKKPQSIEIESVKIYDLLGRLIQNLNLTNVSTEIVIDMTQLKSAAYMFVIKSEDGAILTKQITKE